MKSSPTFCSLAQLLEWTHVDPPSPQCAYLVRAGSPCKGWMSRKISDQARSLVAEHLDLLTAVSEGWTKAFFQKLATIHLCNNHKKHDFHAIEQWLGEFTTGRDTIIDKLEEYYNLDMDDTRTGESEDNADDVESSGIDSEESDEEQSVSEEEDISDEEDASDEEESVSASSSQFEAPIGLLRYTYTIAEDEVAKDVTHLLEQPVKGKSQPPGYIYVIRPIGLLGKLKVGYTTSHSPQVERFRMHQKCHQEFEEVTKRLAPYAYRVEQLLLREFSNKHYTLENACQSCGTYHRELLDVDEDTLLRCLEKWIGFVESCPYNKKGNLTKEAKERLPRPALKSYLGCKPTRHRRSPGVTPTKKRASQGSQIVSPPGVGFRVPTSATKYLNVHETELNHDDLCAAVEGLQLTPSRHRRAVP
ncbi:hypothetical protein FE257_007341 [Aspergillus nanangensis]|uniref:Bacteriophage T5 Orf172 DNA-binding domain-containing protein n=1 Tax=Aspergillus nanangensis TaxID=2582783 RepID=A0AAD4GTD6_ASPNN|nr:hypothetical protein FE257_007341 [Aspergillus nanangensis]